jgi:hypothetical protein
VYSENFEWNEATRTLGIGTDAYPAPHTNAATGAAGAGVLQVGDGTNVASINMDGASADVTLGKNGIDGDLIIGDGAVANATSISLNGAAATATLGHASLAGTVILSDATNNNVTVNTGTQGFDWTLQTDAPGAVGTYYLTPSTNQALVATLDYIYVSNGDGTATWQQNPSAGLKAGVYTHAGADAYTASVVFANAYAAAVVPSVVVTYNDAANANIIQITAISNTGFTVTSTAPITAGDAFNWMASSPVDLP